MINISILKPLGQQVQPVVNARFEAYQMRVHGRNYNTSAVQSNLQGINATVARQGMNMSEGQSSDNRGIKRKPEEENEDDDQAHDEVRLWEDGFKDRYYESKFDVLAENFAFRCVQNILKNLVFL